MENNWWNKNAEKMLGTFNSWVGDLDATTKVIARNYIMERGYKSILDCGFGSYPEALGYKKSGYKIRYKGIDICDFFVKQAKKKKINAILASMEDIPAKNKYFDVVYTRHTVEHCSDYRRAISEMMRVAKNEVIIIFFIPPIDSVTEINYDVENNLYHNKYNKYELESFIKGLPGFESLTWESKDNEAILHIHKCE